MNCLNPDINLDEVAARFGLNRAAFVSEHEFLRSLYIRLGSEVENLQHQVHLRESEHAEAFYAMRALEPADANNKEHSV